jgi:hypothetical protein
MVDIFGDIVCDKLNNFYCGQLSTVLLLNSMN